MIRAAALAMLEDAELMARLREAEAVHGRRNSAAVVARQFVIDRHDLQAIESMAHRLRRMRGRLEKDGRCPVLTIPS